MSNELVEKVAQAMFEHDAVNDERQLAEWPDEWKSNAEFYFSLARVAIKAMGICADCNGSDYVFGPCRCKEQPQCR